MLSRCLFTFTSSLAVSAHVNSAVVLQRAARMKSVGFFGWSSLEVVSLSCKLAGWQKSFRASGGGAFVGEAKVLGSLSARLFGSDAAFGVLAAMLSGSGQGWWMARQAGRETYQLQHNKALHPTAYSFARSSLRFRRRVSLVVRHLLSEIRSLGSVKDYWFKIYQSAG